MDDATRTRIEAATYRRLIEHLMHDRPDAQNIDLMNLAGFCRNCLSRWYGEAAAKEGIDLSKEESREIVYGMPYDDWRAKNQREATPEQLKAFDTAFEQNVGPKTDATKD
ncbi:DUF1244 domain-containing protein [Pararhodobacter marinus]|uniref:DUF1244 domain-containing protein n=1 Tax=Pararhodobacter marinus TaxID=2184063 RepID=A0A2U2C944_9RHOB|nr:DUF1244 domain-containing protein [Pararhodobacter marinus]PWE28314.1 DUF1244 domain-containing protein [Pararhodobacter marinus]